MSYEVGDAVRITADFTNASGAPVDPTVVKFTWRRPGETTETTWTFGVDAELVKAGTPAVGRYYVDLALDKFGADWDYRFAASGTAIQRVFTGKIRVARPTLQTPP